jgi:hypothetical protein
MRRRAAAGCSLLLLLVLPSSPSRADDQEPPQRPSIQFERWREDWSALADPRLRTEPFDNLKYIPLSDTNPRSYASFGLTLRERFEWNNAPSFGVRQSGDSYLLHRLQVHADIHPNENWQIFTQFEDIRAPEKRVITAVDQNPLDLRQAFAAYVNEVGPGELKLRVGRQEMAFDLQRFVSVRDGPNVRQAYDAAWADYEVGPWRVIAFWSHPVQYRPDHTFDDTSNGHFQYGGLRVERQGVGPGDLAAYYSRWMLDNARFLDAVGNERRDIGDLHYGGKRGPVDWDLEAMGQFGSVGTTTVRAWAVGAIAGYTFVGTAWTPRLGLQTDAGSGDSQPGDGRLGTFNPLFPNGYYFTLAGYTSYANVIHVKPSVTVSPTEKLKVMTAVGLQWRETTADAVYVQPNIAVPGTAGRGGNWTGAYGQIRADWAITANLAAAVEAVHFKVGDTIHQAGGHDSDYLGVEMRFGW